MTAADKDYLTAQLAREVADLKAKIDDIQSGSRSSQLPFSSLDINVGKGFLPIYDGKVERARIGRMPDGTVSVVSANNNTPPPAPFVPIVTPLFSSANVEVTQLNTGAVPYDFGYIKVFVNAEHVGNIIRIPGSLIVGPLTPGIQHKIELSAVNQSGTESEKSPAEYVYSRSVVSGINFGEITETHIGDNSITTPKILAAAITTALIAAGAVDADQIKAGAVTASKLEAVMAIVNRLVAGNPTAARLEISAAGMEQYGPTGQLLIQLGSNPGQGRTNIITVVNPNNPNEALATLDSEGTIATSGLSVQGPINLNGVDFSSVIFGLPRGIVAYGRLDVDSNATTSRVGVYELAFDAEAGRTYRIASSSFFIAGRGGGFPGGSLEIRYTTNGTRPTTTSTLMGDASTFDEYDQLSTANGAMTTSNGTNGLTSTDPGPNLHAHNYGANHTHGVGNHQHYTRFCQVATKVECLKQFTTDQRVRIVFCLFSYYGASIVLDDPNGDAGIQFYVEDVGPNTDATGGTSDGTGSGSGGSGQTTTTWDSVYTRSWTGDFANPFINNEMRQGRTAGIDSACSIGFDHLDIRTKLSGATIKKVELWLYAQTWQNDTGGRAVIGHHNDSSAPTAYTFVGRGGKIQDMQRPEGQWIDLAVAYGQALRDNTMKGFVLDARAQSDGTNARYAGQFAPFSDAVRRPKLRITYTK